MVTWAPMATLVFFHAHPDDEVMGTGGSIARAVAEGHRVVLVVATNGDHGEVPDDLAPGETLLERRRVETQASARMLGIDHVEWLGYTDSGMTGWTQNKDPACFWRADLDEAGGRLAAILRAEAADVLVVYDWHGTYGHPDHVQVHRVGHRAADLAGTPRVFEMTWNRDAMAEFAEEFVGEGGDEWDPNGPADDGNPFGEPASAIHLAVDVSEYVARKRAAIACHASQATDVGGFLAMPEDVFALAFSTEWFIRPGSTEPLRHGWLLD
jgi:LmbE family N-acetylglucosaminyl deacetylase